LRKEHRGFRLVCSSACKGLPLSVRICILIAALLLIAVSSTFAAQRKAEQLKPRLLPAYSQTHSSHIAAAASILDYLRCREKGENKADFTARVALFARKCLCDKPGKPYAYPLYDGLNALSDAYDCRLELKERYRNSRTRGITFKELKQELKAGNMAVITLLTGAAAGPDTDRRHGQSYAVSGYRSDDKGDYLLSAAGGKRKEYAFNAPCREMIVLIIGRGK